VFYNAGLICQKRGHFADAISFYQQAIEADPQFAEALLNMGHAQMALGNEDQALASWRRAIKEKPSLADSYFEPVDPHA
jgi:tetratricopeptide (TPR) repeat protein